MSSLIFYTDENQALIATDTLAVSYDGKPFKFTTKAFVIPHLSVIIAGTGFGGFCDRWLVQVNDRMVVRGIDNLDYHTTGSLADQWAKYKEEFSIPDHITTTVYHFGFSEEDHTIHSYAYRSTNGFRSESIRYGLAVKPECAVPDNYNLPVDIPSMMQHQRELQSHRPKEERLYIGGEIHVIHLTKNGFSIYPLARFDDFDSDEDAIYRNFRKV